MRTGLAAAAIVLLASTAWAAVSARVFHADEQTPLLWADPNVPDVYQDIMVGTRLTIFIISDEPGGWAGQLWHSWEDAAIGTICARDEDPDKYGYEGSLLPAVRQEKGALVRDSADETGQALYLVCTAATPAGEWFVVDYYAETLGTCYLGLYADELQVDPNPDNLYIPPTALGQPLGPFVALQALAFNHVASRDFNQDTVVNFVDFALLARAWRSGAPDPNLMEPAPPIDPNTVLSPDLNADDIVDVADWALFSTYWLERTDVNQRAADPNALDPKEDPPGP